ncbi:hypothetical protein [Ornithinimicrobium kibberense]|uniref:hypothetical protein n=1 Tax=Ornithinimicrobium kibberense TaxID=282060 RepID=UPI003623744E
MRQVGPRRGEVGQQQRGLTGVGSLGDVGPWLDRRHRDPRHRVVPPVEQVREPGLGRGHRSISTVEFV